MKRYTIATEIGLPSLLEQCAEECTELAKAALKLARKYRNENPTPRTEEELVKDLEEELADTILCTDLIMEALSLSLEDIGNTIVFKRRRWIGRIKLHKEITKFICATTGKECIHCSPGPCESRKA